MSRLATRFNTRNILSRRAKEYQPAEGAGGGGSDTAGTLSRYFPGVQGYVHTRGSSATYIDVSGVVQSALTNVVRDGHYVGGVQTTLLENQSTNICLQSEDFGTTWSAVGTPTRSAAAHTASGVSLDLIGDDSAAASEYYTQNITFTGDAVKAISVFMKKGPAAHASGSYVYLRDSTAPADRLLATITWDGSGVPSVVMTTGTHLQTIACADGVYRFLFQTTAVTAANTNGLRIIPCLTTDVAFIGNVYAGGVQVENSRFPTSYIKTTSGTVTRSADTFYLTTTDTPQVQTWYVRFIAAGLNTASETSFGVLYLGNAGNSAARLVMYHTTADGYAINHNNNSTGVQVGIATLASLGDTVEIRTVLNADGSVFIGTSINGGAESVSSPTAANTLAGAWGDLRFYLNSVGSSSIGFLAFLSAKRVAGVKTLNQMRAA